MADRNTLLNFLGTAVATFAGVLGSITVAYFTFLNTDRGHDIRMVEISLSILRGEGDKETSLPARKFALDMLEKFSGVEIVPSEADAWARTGTTPFAESGWGGTMLNTPLAPIINCDALSGRKRVACIGYQLEMMKTLNDALGQLDGEDDHQ